MSDYHNYNEHGVVTRDTWDWSNMPAFIRYRDNPNWATTTGAGKGGAGGIDMYDEDDETDNET